MYIRAGTRIKWQARITTWEAGDYINHTFVYGLKNTLTGMGWIDVAVNYYGVFSELVIVQATAPIDFNDINDIRALFTGIAQRYVSVATGTGENQIWIDGAPPNTASGAQTVTAALAQGAGNAARSVADEAEKQAGKNPLLIAAAIVVGFLVLRERL